MRRRNSFLSSITDEELFLSTWLKKEYEDLALALTSRADPRISVKLLKSIEGSDEFIARTNGAMIQMHPFASEFEGLSRHERYGVLYGVVTHEIAHVLYTDFRKHIFAALSTSGETMHRILRKTGINLDEKSYAAKGWIVDIQNAIEDGYIENAFATDYSGVPSIYLRRARAFLAKGYDPVEQMLRDLGPSAAFVSNCTLIYATTGRLDFTGFPADDELAPKLQKLMEIIDDAVIDTDQINRWVAAAEIYKLFEDIFEEAAEKGESPSTSDRDVKENSLAAAPEKPKDISDHRPEKPKEGKKEDSSRGKDTEGSEDKGEKSKESSEKPEVSDADGDLAAASADDILKADLDASVARVMKGIAEEKEEEEINAERHDDAKDVPGESSGDFKLVPANPKQWQTYEETSGKYADIMKDVKPISKRLQRSLISEMQDREYGSKRSGLLVGKRFEAGNAYRMDMRTFSTNKAPTELKSLAVAVLVDMSGSMRCDDRMPAAIKTAVLVQDFCSGLNYPVAVYGHEADYSGCNVYTFTEWSDKGKEMIADMRPMRDNHDGHALRYVKKRLLKRPEPNKLLIYISDGVPCNCSFPGVRYYGPEAVEDLKSYMKEARKDDVTMICAGIGSDKEELSAIYGDAFMDISDLSRFPVQIVRYLKRMIMRVE